MYFLTSRNIKYSYYSTIISRLAILYNLNSSSFSRPFAKPVSTICLIQLQLLFYFCNTNSKSILEEIHSYFTFIS